MQTRRLITSISLAEKFGISTRTIYKNLIALEQAGVPVLTEAGKGYSLMEASKIRSIMFSENQANALIIAEQLVLKNKDNSLIKDYTEAIDKVKTVLRQTANLLSERTVFGKIKKFERNSNSLSALQNALTNFYLIKLDYINAENKKTKELLNLLPGLIL